MDYYEVILTRDTTESAIVKVQLPFGASEAQIEAAAINKAMDPNQPVPDWQPDDWAGRPYCGDPTFYNSIIPLRGCIAVHLTEFPEFSSAW